MSRWARIINKSVACETLYCIWIENSEATRLHPICRVSAHFGGLFFNWLGVWGSFSRWGRNAEKSWVGSSGFSQRQPNFCLYYHHLLQWHSLFQNLNSLNSKFFFHSKLLFSWSDCGHDFLIVSSY